MADRKPTPDIFAAAPVDVLGDVLSGKPQTTWPQEVDYPIDRIIVGRRHRQLKDITSLKKSIEELGLLSRIVILPDGTLVAGRHRLQCATELGWSSIPAKIVEMDDIDAELAEIDENLSRVELTVLEQAEHLLRREELLEAKGLRAKQGDNRFTIDRGLTVSPLSTTTDIAQSMGLSEASAKRRLQIAKNLDDDAKATIRDNEDIANSTTQLLELSRMEPTKQRTVADMIMRGEAANVMDAARKLEPPPAPTQDTENNHESVVGSEASGTRQKGAELAKCTVCHRPLSDPNSAIAGVGPCCANKRAAAAAGGGDGDTTDDADESDNETVDTTDEPLDTEEQEETSTLPHVARNSGNNEWYTPAEYIEAARAVLGCIDLDPASSETANQVVGATSFYSAEDDGLTMPWVGKVWMNPPYSSDLIGKFSAKLVDHVCTGSVKEAIVLVNNATETSWFRTLATNAQAVVFPGSRIQFWQPGGKLGAPLQGQAFVYFGNDAHTFLSEFSRFGWGARL